MIINVPIEPLEERYSTQWQRWFERAWQEEHIDYINMLGAPLTEWIESGSFLDVCGTHYYKASQLQKIAEYIHVNRPGWNTVFFFHDLWFPGIEALAYMRDGLGLEFRIMGCLHAGSYDPHDFLAKKGMGHWGKKLEESWFRIFDKIFVATNFHKRLLIEKREIDPNIIHVTGFPIYYECTDRMLAKKRKKKKLVVFPHRLNEEKNPHLFDHLTKQCKINGWKFVKTKDVCKTKEEYYELLHEARIAVSFADQETWGIAMQEALFAGCIPLVPDRLSYSEMYKPLFLFGSLEEACSRTRWFMASSSLNEGKDTVMENAKDLRYKGATAIKNMNREMGV